MELIGSLLFVLAVGLVVAVFIARPFLRSGFAHTRTLEAAQQLEHDRSSLLAERDRLLNALQELDFDHALGKVPDEDYPLMRDDMLRAGANVLRKLEAIEGPASPGLAGASAEDRIEAVVAARRADSARTKASGTNGATIGAPDASGATVHGATAAPAAVRGDAIEELIATRKRARQESASGFCPKCGKPAQKSDKFCSKCGATL
jgi:hypothetical protein